MSTPPSTTAAPSLDTRLAEIIRLGKRIQDHPCWQQATAADQQVLAQFTVAINYAKLLQTICKDAASSKCSSEVVAEDVLERHAASLQRSVCYLAKVWTLLEASAHANQTPEQFSCKDMGGDTTPS
ncbi:MAG: hypothetical protein AAF708_10815 [Deinococcota bacterium]